MEKSIQLIGRLKGVYLENLNNQQTKVFLSQFQRKQTDIVFMVPDNTQAGSRIRCSIRLGFALIRVLYSKFSP